MHLGRLSCDSEAVFAPAFLDLHCGPQISDSQSFWPGVFDRRACGELQGSTASASQPGDAEGHIEPDALHCRRQSGSCSDLHNQESVCVCVCCIDLLTFYVFFFSLPCRPGGCLFLCMLCSDFPAARPPLSRRLRPQLTR